MRASSLTRDEVFLMSTKILKRKNTANLERMKEVLSEMPETDIVPESTVSADLIPTTNSTEKPKKKPPVNKRAYTYDECARIVEMINEGKSLDEIHQVTKRPVLSLMYKFFNPKRGVKMCRDVNALKEFFREEV
jgi:hypothetical protein